MSRLTFKRMPETACSLALALLISACAQGDDGSRITFNGNEAILDLDEAGRICGPQREDVVLVLDRVSRNEPEKIIVEQGECFHLNGISTMELLAGPDEYHFYDFDKDKVVFIKE